MQDNWDETEKRMGRPTFAAPKAKTEALEKLREWVTKKRDELNRYFHDLNYLGTVVLPFKPQDVAMLDAILATLPPAGRVAVFATPEAVAHVTEGAGTGPEIPEDKRGLFKALEDSMTSRGWIGHGRELEAIRTLILSEGVLPAPPSKEWEARLDALLQQLQENAPISRLELIDLLAGIGIQRGKEE